jgi:hypothetical protein
MKSIIGGWLTANLKQTRNTTRALRVIAAGVVMFGILQSRAAQSGVTVRGDEPCDGQGSWMNTTTWTEGPYGHGTYQKTVVYNGNCKTTITYTFNGSLYRGPEVWNLYGNCGCAPLSGLAAPGSWGSVDIALTNIDNFTFTAVAPTNSIDHFTIYGLNDAGVILDSGTLSGPTPSFTVSNGSLTDGGHYAIAACTSDNIIQGGACFQANSGGIIPLGSVHDWQNNANAPGTTLGAFITTNQLMGIVQLADKSVISATGTFTRQAAAIYGGVRFEALNGAALNLQSNHLVVSLIGTQGMDGVLRADARLGLNLHWADVTTTNPWPADSFFEWQFLKSGSNNTVAGRLRTVQDGSEMAMMADYSGIGATNYYLLFYGNGQLLTNRLVAATNGGGSTVLWKTAPGGGSNSGNGGDSGGGSTDIHVQEGFCTENGFIVPGLAPRSICPCEEYIGWPGGAGAMPCKYEVVTYSGGASIHGVNGTVDAVVLAAAGPLPAMQYDRLQLAAVGVPDLTITDTSINPFGAPVHVLGQALINASSNGTPVVGFIGTNGLDGVSLALGGVASARVELSAAPNLIPAGAILTGQARGTLNGITNQPLQSIRFEQTATNTMITSDFTALGAAMQRVQVFSNGTSVYNSTNSASLIIIMHDGEEAWEALPTWSWGTDLIEIGWKEEWTNWPGISILDNGGWITLHGNEIRFSALGCTNTVTSGLSAVTLTGANLDSISIASETVTALPLVLHSVLTSTNMIVSWPGRGTLQQSSDLVAWTDILGVSSPYAAPINSPMKFFRVRKP